MKAAKKFLSGFVLSLVLAVSLFNAQFNAQIVFAETTEAEADEISETEHVTSLNKPAVVRVLNEFCVEVDIPYDFSMPTSTGQTLSWCDLVYGSGFFVEYSGYIITNAHVAVNPPYMTMYEMVYYYGVFDDYVVEFIVDFSAAYGETITLGEASIIFQADADYYRDVAAYYLVLLLEDGGAEYTVANDYYIQYTEADISLDYEGIVDTSSLLEADLVDYIYDDMDPETMEYSYTGDVALLKTTVDGDYPITNLGDTDDLTEGVDVVVLGFPGVVDYTLNSFSSSDYDLLTLTGMVTVTRGVVSAIRADQGLVQIDASISEGNSGGPGFGSNGDVVGIVTYKTLDSGAADYNYLRMVEEVKRLMNRNDIDNEGGVVDLLWRDGMEAYMAGEYMTSITMFEELENEFPKHKSVSRYLELAKENAPEGVGGDIPTGLDMSGTVWAIVICGAVLFGVIVIGGVIAFVVVANKKKKSKPTQAKQANSSAL